MSASRIRTVILLLLTLLLTVTGQPAMATLQIAVPIAPLAFLAERTGGGLVRVHTLLPDGRDPHHFEPGPTQMLALGKAAVYYSAGLEFEKTLTARLRSSYPHLKIVAADRGVARPDQEDPHLWMAPPLAKQMARNMADCLVSMDAANRETYRRNLARLEKELDRLHQRLLQDLAPFHGKVFFTYHGGFGAFASTYGLIQQPVETEGKRPGPRQLARLIRLGRTRDIRVLLVQPQFAPENAATVARALHASTVTIDPLAYDLPATWRQLAESLRKAFSR